MEKTDKEKEWLRSFNCSHPRMEEVSNDTSVECRVSKTLPSMHKGRGFADVAGMNTLKQFVTEGFINVLRHRECAEAYGIRPPSMLFYGPSGCGKTFFAEKMAEEVGINFIKVVPDDLASQMVHGTQQKIHQVFCKAEEKAPVLLFFDEFDAMVPCRSAAEGSQHTNGEVNEFLCKLNNASDRGIYVLAASNHPEQIDRAVLRTGRIDEMVYIPMPDAEARENLFTLSLRTVPKSEDIDFRRLSALTDGFNCSDISYIVKAASRTMFNATIAVAGQPYKPLTQAVLEQTIAKHNSSVRAADLREYERIHREFAPKECPVKSHSIGYM